MEMYSGSTTVDDWGVGCNTSSPPVSVPGPPNYLSCSKEAGMHVRGQAYIRSKRLGKNDVTLKPNICLSTCLCYRDAHEYASFFSNGSTGSKAGRNALCRFQNAGARWALGTESQVQMETESSPTLPTRVL